MRKGMKRFMSMGLGAVIALTGTGASTMCVQAADDPVEISIAYWDADSAFVGDDVLSEIEDKLKQTSFLYCLVKYVPSGPLSSW